ncbi:MAG: universal stress protein [Acidobacteria bacterium]|nr:universal stress protein [Acidobacteriota bacterium]MCI0621851.1 universal stress protein [Acidobacteriota bacterium]MCI0724042.1 universal stress protein [Acidobacteriota bacterium]
MKILIAYDGSSCADAALVDLQRAGLPGDVEALVISVADVWLWPGSNQAAAESSSAMLEMASVTRARQRALQAVEEARALALQGSERVGTKFPSWTVQAEAYGESPAWAIIRKAHDWKADLVVVGSHGRSAFGRLILGSVSQKVVTEASRSVRVGRGRVLPSNSPVRIVIGVDGSPGSEVAVRAVTGRSWPASSQARVIGVLDSMMVTAMEQDEEVDQDEWAWARKRVEASEETLRASGLVVSSVVKEGDPKQVLIDEAEQWEADCIFVGARGLRSFERFLLGSVSTAVVARAHCSVEVVRTGQ